TVVGSSDNVPSAAVIKNADGEDVTASYEIQYENGTLTVTKAKLTITANNQTYEFNGDIQGEGDVVYADPSQIAQKVTVDGLKGDDALTSIELFGQGKEAGTYDIDVFGAQVNGSDPDNYEVVYVKGTLTITPIGEYTITVRGYSATRTYNGAARTISGYTFSRYDSSIEITKMLAQDDAKATATGTRVGTYRMTMTAADFEAKSDNYSRIIFRVIPGTLRITPVPDDDERIVDPEVPLAAPAAALGNQVGECFE
ncbi:MAG: hypothetical protein IJJ92_07685, partial [Clostridia bacterium]|nr:hypothetical protein [Clostridia bacterium]